MLLFKSKSIYKKLYAVTGQESSQNIEKKQDICKQKEVKKGIIIYCTPITHHSILIYFTLFTVN